jgi:TRAP-type C4-dicarboxylate transport system permease small subunit
MEARLRRWFCALVDALLALAVALLTVAAAAQVALRYLFVSPWPWMEQLSVILMIWMAWLGASYLGLRHAHVAIDSVIERLSSHWRGALHATFDLAAIGFGAGTFAASFATFRAFAGMELGDLPIAMSVNYQPIAVGALLLAMAGVLNLWRRARPG